MVKRKNTKTEDNGTVKATEATEAPETTETTETTEENKIPDEIRDAFQKAKAEENDEDLIKIEMITAGAKFKQVTRMFNDLMIEFGFSVSKKEKADIAKTSCEGIDIASKEGFDEAVIKMASASEKVNNRIAAIAIRAFAKKENIDVYKVPKGDGTRTTFMSEFYDALIENPCMTEKEVHDIIVEKGTPNTLRLEKTYQKTRIAFNKLVDRLGIETVVTKEV